MGGELEAEAGRLGMNAVAAADGDDIEILLDAFLGQAQKGIEIVERGSRSAACAS